MRLTAAMKKKIIAALLINLMILVFRIAEIGAFSAPLQQILQFLLNDAKTMRKSSF